jgi:hypothetical protein
MQRKPSPSFSITVTVTPADEGAAGARAENAARRRKATDVVARFSAGIEAVDDGVGSVVIEDQHDGFVVFVDGGTLPNGDNERRFTGANSCPDAYRFAMSVLADIVADQVSMTGDAS